jgi:hypothetical protein
VRSFLEPELAALLPGGIDALTYAETATIRLPVSIAFTEQSKRDEVLALLRADIDGGTSTGFEPADENGEIVVSFRTCVVHAVRPSGAAAA